MLFRRKSSNRQVTKATFYTHKGEEGLVTEQQSEDHVTLEFINLWVTNTILVDPDTKREVYFSK